MTLRLPSHLARTRVRLLELKRREDGAVTVDWVVLTAGLVVLGFLILGGLAAPVTETIDKTISKGNELLD